METEIGSTADPVERFFAYARERHSIYLRRAAGQKSPWTSDPILQAHRFTNVFRELDRTTVWFRENVRDRLRDKPEVLPATIIFRWFNRIKTGEALFCQEALGLGGEKPGETAFEAFLRLGGEDGMGCLRAAILQHCGDGPYVTGAYTINTISAGLGLSKLEGVLNLIGQWFDAHRSWRQVAVDMKLGSRHVPQVKTPFSLEDFCAYCRSPCLGEFMTYEVACDLRYTALLENAPDRRTWANLGPGARRGLNRIFRGLQGKAADKAIPMSAALGEMQELLARSQEPSYWPQLTTYEGERALIFNRGPFYVHGLEPRTQQWPSWELREVEHTLCEFDKYSRVLEGSGRPRGSAPR